MRKADRMSFEDVKAGMLDMMARVRARTGRSLPRWRDYRPSDFAPFAADMQVFEVHDIDDIRVRYIGVGLEKLVGANIKLGDGQANTISPADRAAVWPFYIEALKHPAAATVTRELAFKSGKTVIARTISLPAANETDEPAYVILYSWTEEPFHAKDMIGCTYLISALDYIDIGNGMPSRIYKSTARLELAPAAQRLIDE